MIYLVECNFINPSIEEDWNTWYSAHLRDLLSIEGFSTAQRFRSFASGFPTYRALYAVESAAVFSSDSYARKKGGRFPEEWRSSIVDWRRNLFAGLDAPPAVQQDECLVLATDQSVCVDLALTSLHAIALDKSSPLLGIGVVSREQGVQISKSRDSRIIVSEPITPYRTSASHV